jgi:hypothetical protein
MTEAEARKTWCHRVPRDPRDPVPVGKDLPPSMACISTACAAWRWGPRSGSAHGYNVGREGYCGLAGDWKPQ